jgi:ribose-phosphate pyrophosphokinase
MHSNCLFLPFTFASVMLCLYFQVYACTSHAVFSPPAIERLSSGVFSEVIVTNTIPVAPENVFPQLTILSVANLLGETVWRVYNASSVQALRD